MSVQRIPADERYVFSSKISSFTENRGDAIEFLKTLPVMGQTKITVIVEIKPTDKTCNTVTPKKEKEKTQ